MARSQNRELSLTASALIVLPSDAIDVKQLSRDSRPEVMCSKILQDFLLTFIVARPCVSLVASPLIEPRPPEACCLTKWLLVLCDSLKFREWTTDIQSHFYYLKKIFLKRQIIK